MPGHESGHEPAPPVGYDWGAYVSAFVEAHGGWAALADELLRRGARAEEVPSDPHVVEKGLRRLAARGHKSGGQYGRWLIRFFGIPSSLTHWAQWMGQLHSRFADLPSSLRLEQLGLWDRPPVSESRITAWVHVGLASVLLRMQQNEDAERRLAMAEASAEQAGSACRMEVALLRAKILTDAGRRGEAEARFDAVQALLEADDVLASDRRAYHARLVGQRAYHLTREAPGYPEDVSGAMRLFESIDDAPFLPFVAFRKCNGLGYCHWKLGDVAEGLRWARLAEQHAGDGGFVRFRIMALNLQARMLAGDAAESVRMRAERLAQLVEDEDLLRRVRARW